MEANTSPSMKSQPTSIAMTGRSADFDLDREIEDLSGSPEWETGISRKLLVRYPDLQVTLRRMKANTRIAEHHNPGRICVQTLRGHLRMRADGKVFDLPQGKILVLDRAVTHDVEALRGSAFLLTVAYPEASTRR